MKKIILQLVLIVSASCNPVEQSKSEQVNVTAPKSKPSTFETDDSSFLSLSIRSEKFEVNFLKKMSMFDNIQSLDTFFQNNQQIINKEKVVIAGFDTSKNNKRMEDLLSKYGITKFRINAEERK